MRSYLRDVGVDPNFKVDQEDWKALVNFIEDREVLYTALRTDLYEAEAAVQKIQGTDSPLWLTIPSHPRADATLKVHKRAIPFVLATVSLEDVQRHFTLSSMNRRQYRWFGLGSLPADYNFGKESLRASPASEAMQALSECLANLGFFATMPQALLIAGYFKGTGVCWHSDREDVLAAGQPVLTLSLGAEARFQVRATGHAQTEADVTVQHGDVVAMLGADFQRVFQHRAPADKGDDRNRFRFALSWRYLA